MAIILSLCDYSGTWSQPYVDAGYDVRQYDLAGNGIDIRLLKMTEKVHGILAAPPCTCFSKASNAVKRTDEQMIDALSIVDACLRFVAVCKPEWWCLENPVGRLKYWLGEPAMRFDPCDYAGWSDNPLDEAYLKYTCLWGNFSPPIARYEPAWHGDMTMVHNNKATRTQLRSITPSGFARAFFAANP